VILSQTAVYALKAALYLADAPDENPVRVDDIATALDVPRNYLSKILHVLARAGLLHSTRGPKGGFRLARSARALRLSDIIGPFDEIAESSGCLLGREVCSDNNPCAAHTRWKSVSSAVRSFLGETSIHDLSSRGPAEPRASLG
jgi:Rrf2 family protein